MITYIIIAPVKLYVLKLELYLVIILINYTLLVILLLSLFFLYIISLVTILKTNENAISCDKDANKNYTESLHLFRRKRKLMWLGDELERYTSSLFHIHCPDHHWQYVRGRIFDSSHQIYCRQLNWVIKLIASLGIKHITVCFSTAWQTDDEPQYIHYHR